MPLRLANKARTYPIQACDTTFHIISMSIGDKERLVNAIQTIGPANGAYDRLLDVIAPAIIKIDGYDEEPRVVLGRLEELADMRAIVMAIIAHCALTATESKNLSSSSVQHTPESVGSAASPAGPDGVPVSTTPTQKDS